MIKRALIFPLLMTLLLLSSSFGVVSAENATSQINEAIMVLREITSQPDSEPMLNLLQQAHGVAIFPSVIKAGLMIGGRYGEGIVLQYDQTSDSWSGPYFVEMKGLSYGFQIGVQSTALVLVIANERGMEGFKENKITLGGNLSIAAGPVGRSAEAGTDSDLRASIYSYSMSKGAFAGMSVEGAVLNPNNKLNLDYWKSSLQPEQMLSRGANDIRVLPLIDELNRLIKRGRELTI